MARLVLMVRCPACGHAFDTGIRMDRRNFDRATFAANYHPCPRCGQRGMFRKEQYEVIEEHIGARATERDEEDRKPGR